MICESEIAPDMSTGDRIFCGETTVALYVQRHQFNVRTACRGDATQAHTRPCAALRRRGHSAPPLPRPPRRCRRRTGLARGRSRRGSPCSGDAPPYHCPPATHTHPVSPPLRTRLVCQAQHHTTGERLSSPPHPLCTCYTGTHV